MNILIDGRPLVASSAGITTFLKCSVAAWARLRPYDMLYIALPAEPDKTFSSDGLPSNVQLVVKTNALLRLLPNLVWLNVMMPLLARRWKATVYYSPLPCVPFFLPRDIKKVIVVHDVVNIEYRKTMQWTNVISNMLFFSRSVKTADILWTNSEYTAGKVRHYFPVRRAMDIFTGCSIDRKVYKHIDITRQERRAVMERHGISRRFLLFVGSLEPRKNLRFLLQMMPEIYRLLGLQLVVVGARGWKATDIRTIVEAEDYPRDSVVFCGFVYDRELVQLYNTAECFVSPSLNEGFGMPQLEALCCGCPVVTAHNSAMAEVAQGKSGAVTVEGYDPTTWIEAITNAVERHPATPDSELADYDWDKIVSRLHNKIFISGQ